MAGPSAVGAIADAFSGDLHTGIAFGLVFPAAMAVALFIFRFQKSGKALLNSENLQ